MAAWAWRPVADGSVLKQASGSLVAPSKITTWPLATNARIAWVSPGLKSSMWGRTGLAPVLARHS